MKQDMTWMNSTWTRAMLSTWSTIPQDTTQQIRETKKNHGKNKQLKKSKLKMSNDKAPRHKEKRLDQSREEDFVV